MKPQRRVLEVFVIHQGQFGNIHASPACRSLSSLSYLFDHDFSVAALIAHSGLRSLIAVSITLSLMPVRLTVLVSGFRH